MLDSDEGEELTEEDRKSFDIAWRVTSNETFTKITFIISIIALIIAIIALLFAL